MDKQQGQFRSAETEPDKTVCNAVEKKTSDWLPLVRLAVIRNVVVGLVMASALIAVLYLVFTQPWQDQSALPTGEPTTPATPTSAAPMIPASTPGQTEYRLPPDIPLPERPEVIEPPPEIMALAKPPLHPQCIDGEMCFDCTESNIATVETTDDYVHQIVTMGEGQYHHIYIFTLACGHTIMTTPDPYRNVMYKYPEKMAAKYREITCEECKALQAALEGKGNLE